MQYIKDEIRQRIIDVAREEFIQNGFEKSSIRTITTRAETAKSNLYNYFKDKDDLFCFVLEPTISKIRKELEMAKQFNVPKGIDKYIRQWQVNIVDSVCQFVAENSTDIRLLLFKTQGSSLVNFKYQFLEDATDIMYSWEKSVVPSKEISRLFTWTVCSFYLSLIEQALLYGKKEEMQKFREDFTLFVYHGWKGILQ